MQKMFSFFVFSTTNRNSYLQGGYVSLINKYIFIKLVLRIIQLKRLVVVAITYLMAVPQNPIR